MNHQEYGELLNTLLEAERAGAKLLAVYAEDVPADAEEWQWLRDVQRDEAGNCAVLLRLLRDAGAPPSAAVGRFYDKGLTITGWEDRLAFLNRGQQWVADRLAAALPAMDEGPAKDALREMHASHVANIGICDEKRRSR
jgi:nitronate monooxygenase